MLARLLGIDFGTKRIGVAVNFGSIAEPLLIAENTEQIWETFKQLVTEHRIQEIVIGISENEMAENARQFGEQVTQKLGLPVHFWDETLTTVEAKARLAESGKKIDVRELDHLSAALILQDYIDMHSSSAQE